MEPAMCTRLAQSTLTVILLALSVLIGFANAASALVGLNSSATATGIGNELVGSGLTVNRATIIGSGTQSAVFSNGSTGAPGVAPSDKGLVLSRWL